MKSAATEKSAADHVLNQILVTLQLPPADVFSSYVIKGAVGVNSQFSSITSVGFFAMGLSGRMCTETREDVDT